MAYLFKLKQSKGVKELVRLRELDSEWQSGIGSWQYCESTLKLTGWDCSRRVVIYRRAHHRKGATVKVAASLLGSIEQVELLPLEVIE